MNNEPQKDQEIDLGDVINKIKDFFNGLIDRFFDLIFFIKKKFIPISILFIVGAGLGFYLDKERKNYNHEVIVMPNFGSTDYLYSKIELLEAKKKENDTAFFKSIGINDIEKLRKIEIEPIIDVYKFINEKNTNFDLIKLMAEDGDLKEIIKSTITSKNYLYHSILIKTLGEVREKELIDPLLKFLNDSQYFKVIQKQIVDNITTKINVNQQTITQIDHLLNEFSKTTEGNQKSDKLVYYNENNQLNEIIKNKEDLVTEVGNNKIILSNSDKIIKEIATTLNVRDTKGIVSKRKILFPVLLVVFFILGSLFIDFYKKQLNKRKN